MDANLPKMNFELGNRSRLVPAAVCLVILALLASGLPEIEVHGHADTATTEVTAAADLHHDEADVWGDRDGLHIHACACVAHCSAFPSAFGEVWMSRCAPVTSGEWAGLSPGITAPPFRPPIA